MWISEEQVKKLAVRAKLNLREEEVPFLRQQLQDLLDHADMASEELSVAEAILPPGASAVASCCWTSQTLMQDEVLLLAPDSQQGFIRVHRVLGDD